MHHSSVSWEITLLYFFSWKFIWFRQNEPIRLSSAHVKFHQICSLIGSFCLKYIKFQLKQLRGVMSHDTKEGCKIWRKTNLLFQKFGEFWPEHLKVSKACTLISFFCEKYIAFDLKRYRGVIFHDTEERCKIWRKTDSWFEEWDKGIRALESLKIGTLMGTLYRKCISLKRVLLNPPTTDPPTTDQPTTDHLLTDPPTTDPPTQ